MKTDIDINIIKRYINSDKIDEIRLKQFLRLYSNYSKLEKFTAEELEEYENKVYTISGNVLTDKEKIKKEIITIKFTIKACEDKNIVNYVNEKIDELESILDYNDGVYEGYLFYLKKTICELQSLLNLNISFYNTSRKLFLEEYDAIKNKYETDDVVTNKKNYI